MKLSIITPSFNQGKYIEQTIQSVLNENNSMIEYIVIDGGSTDETVSILQKYAGIKWVSEKDNGQSHAINKGIKMAAGEIIGWINSDDLYYPNALNTVIEWFNKNPQADFLYGDIEYINENGDHLFTQTGHVISFENLISDPYIMRQPSCFWRKSVIEKCGMLRENLHVVMDLDLTLRILKSSEAHYFPMTYSKFRFYDQGKSLRLFKKQFYEMLIVLWPYWLFKFKTFKFLFGRWLDIQDKNSIIPKLFRPLRKS